MEIQLWTIIQIIIDIIMVVVLLWFVKYGFKQKNSGLDYKTAFQTAETILSEMHRISRDLDKNLEQKKIIGANILNQLDTGLERAEERYHQINKILQQSNVLLNDRPASTEDMGHKNSLMGALLKKGLSREEIAMRTDTPIGEVDLFIKLQS